MTYVSRETWRTYAGEIASKAFPGEQHPLCVNYKDVMLKDLQDLYQTESEQASQLPQLASQVSDEGLRAALEQHAQETEQQVLRLRQIFEMASVEPGGEGEVPAGAKGLIAEAHKKVQMVQDPDLKDLVIIGCLQKIEHLEMACYGTARAMAHTAGLTEAAGLLQTTLREEEQADKKLTEAALPIHKKAAQKDESIEQ